MGFFSKKDTTQKVRVESSSRLGCWSCGLHKTCLTPKMEPTGKGEKGILVVAEAPGEKEDRKGIQLVGPAGRTLRRVMQKYGVDLDRDCWKTNAVRCRPPKNRTPEDTEILACRQHVLELIKEKKPKLIIALGTIAVKALTLERYGGEDGKIGGITQWRGLQFPDREFGCWMVPMFHPSYVMRSLKEKVPHKEVETIFKQDMELAIRHTLETPFPHFVDERNGVEILREEDEIGKVLSDLDMNLEAPLGFDYETTGLKPHRKGHKIHCVSFCWTEGQSIVFRMPKKSDNLVLLRKVLAQKRIPKMAHNMKFEDTWSKVRVKVTPQNWYWDSMLAAHVIDNRKAFVSLDFQTYLYAGVPDYSSKVKEFLKGTEKHGNAFNRIFEAEEDDIMLYCGLDTIYEHMIATQQMNQIANLAKLT